MSGAAFAIALAVTLGAFGVLLICMLLYLHEGVKWVMGKVERKVVVGTRRCSK